MAVTLAYWHTRGLAQPIRLLLEYTGTKFEDKFFVCGDAPDYDKSCWFDIKDQLGMNFPNLPYLIDGDRKIVQSNAIMRYVARKHNLCGETEDEKVRVDIMENQAMDFRNGFILLCYTDFDRLKPGYLQALPGTLKQFSSFLGDRKWFAGDKITFVDFIMYELLDQHRMFQPQCLDAFKNLRGLLDRFEIAQPIRLLLEYTGTNYVDKFYVCGEAPDYDLSSWLNEKYNLGMDFPNLPYLIDGDRKIVQSNAIIKYIARRHNLCGETDDEKILVDIMENQAMDFRNGFTRLCYTDYDNLKPGYLEALPVSLEQFSKFLGDRKWFAGDKITYVDFIMYELLDQHRMFEPTCLDKFKNLEDLLDRFEALENIDAYMKSDRFMKTPVNDKMAKWGNKKE
ncbi:uncharacterized protein V6R79_011166 [Siganus canaliculatus]